MRRWHPLARRTHAGPRDSGETPVAVLIGLTIFTILALSAGPTLVAFTAHATANSNDRRMDKALAVLTDTTRREPWEVLAIGGPTTHSVDLAGYTSPVTQWVQPDPASASRRLVTEAVAPHLSGVDCTSAATPAALPSACIVRTAVVAATATDVRPPMSPLATVPNPALEQTSPVALTGGVGVFTMSVAQPTRVAVIARTSSDLTLNLTASGIERARLDMRASTGTGTQWRFGNAVLCPNWSRGGTASALLETPASVSMSDLLVISAPAPASACP